MKTTESAEGALYLGKIEMPRMRILERITGLEDRTAPKNFDDHALVMQSIIHHLRNLLNTRIGSVMIDEDYGVPEFSDNPGKTESPENARLEECILRAITKFEPRLARVRIAVDTDSKDRFARKFILEAYLEEHQGVPVIFETIVNTDGRIDVSPY